MKIFFYNIQMYNFKLIYKLINLTEFSLGAEDCESICKQNELKIDFYFVFSQ